MLILHLDNLNNCGALDKILEELTIGCKPESTFSASTTARCYNQRLLHVTLNFISIQIKNIALYLIR
ncbi:hypothetical protein C3B55_00775 [Candidatus Pseudomonas adelgestsugas]|uniref:Uncharacterized protein n=1 Tax=Candidatus Pseudomonas adelgestsugas TaxID=1302376 RepID=A0ABX5RA01_9PSED|nr:hypothetical protein C3B55_00775 [Candidatus Pseudomonas adelgestsugas]